MERIEAKFSDENELNELLDEISYSMVVPDDNAKDLLMQSSLFDKNTNTKDEGRLSADNSDQTSNSPFLN